jgi:hypothetical protein
LARHRRIGQGCTNYPTPAESYKVAALDATNKMRQVERFST